MHANIQQTWQINLGQGWALMLQASREHGGACWGKNTQTLVRLRACRNEARTYTNLTQLCTWAETIIDHSSITMFRAEAVDHCACCFNWLLQAALRKSSLGEKTMRFFKAAWCVASLHTVVNATLQLNSISLVPLERQRFTNTRKTKVRAATMWQHLKTCHCSLPLNHAFKLKVNCKAHFIKKYFRNKVFF